MPQRINPILSALLAAAVAGRDERGNDVFKMLLDQPRVRREPEPCDCMTCRTVEYLKEKLKDPKTPIGVAKRLRHLPHFNGKIGDLIELLGWKDEVWDFLIDTYTDIGFQHMPELARMFKSFSDQLGRFCQQLDDAGANITDLRPAPPTTPVPEMRNPPAAAGPHGQPERDGAVHEEQQQQRHPAVVEAEKNGDPIPEV